MLECCCADLLWRQVRREAAVRQCNAGVARNPGKRSLDVEQVFFFALKKMYSVLCISSFKRARPARTQFTLIDEIFHLVV